MITRLSFMRRLCRSDFTSVLPVWFQGGSQLAFVWPTLDAVLFEFATDLIFVLLETYLIESALGCGQTLDDVGHIQAHVFVELLLCLG